MNLGLGGEGEEGFALSNFGNEALLVAEETAGGGGGGVLSPV